MITAKINVQKIDKQLLFKGEKGTYLDVVLIENKDGEDQYGNSGFIAQELSKEARDRGERGAIIGNFKIIGRKSVSQPPRNAPPAQRQGPPQRPQGRPLPQRPENDYEP